MKCVATIFAYTALLLTDAALSTPAFAQDQVLGSSRGKSCFDTVQANTVSARRQERVCDLAVQDISLSRRDLSASYVNRGIARTRKEDYEGALADYQEAKRLDPELSGIYINEAVALIQIGDYWSAIEQLNTSLELGTDEPHLVHYHLGLAWEYLGDIPEAYSEFQRAAEAKPDWPLAREQLGRFSVLEQ